MSTNLYFELMATFFLFFVWNLFKYWIRIGTYLLNAVFLNRFKNTSWKNKGETSFYLLCKEDYKSVNNIFSSFVFYFIYSRTSTPPLFVV